MGCSKRVKLSPKPGVVGGREKTVPASQGIPVSNNDGAGKTEI